MSNKYKKLTQNTIIFTIGNLGSTLISFLLLPIFTNFLTAEQYGQIDFITITITLLTPFITLNIVEAILRFSVDKLYDKKSVFSTSIIMFLAIYLIVGLAIISINCLFSASHRLFQIWTLIAVGAIYPMFQQFTRAIGENKLFAISDILYTAIFSSFNIIMITVLRRGVEGYFISYIVANLICIVFLGINAKLYRFIDLRKFNRNYLKEFLKYSLPMIPNSLSWWIMEVSDRYVITFFCGVSTLGIYSVANKIPMIIRNFYNIFYKAWQISSFEESNSDELGEFYSIIFKYLSLFLTLLGMIILTGLNIISNILIGDKFKEAIYYIPILLIALIFYCYSSFLGTVYTSLKKTKIILKTSILCAIINLIINLLFIKTIGPIIAAISTFISYFVLFIYRYIDVKKYLCIRINIKINVISFLMIILQSIVLFIINNNILELCINVVIIIIFICINIKDIISIKNKFIKSDNKRVDSFR